MSNPDVRESLQQHADQAGQRVDALHAVLTDVERQRDALAQLLRATAEHLGMEADVDLAAVPAAAAAAVDEARRLRRQLGASMADRQRLTAAVRGMAITAPAPPSIEAPPAPAPPPTRPWWKRIRTGTRAVTR